jgi:hypothetical protein
MRERRLQKKMKGPDIFAPKKKENGIFAPGNLKKTVDGAAPQKAAPAKKGKSPFGNVFAPSNLDEVSGGDKKKPAAGKPGKPNNPFGNVFAPNNLEKAGPKN